MKQLTMNEKIFNETNENLLLTNVVIFFISLSMFFNVLLLLAIFATSWSTQKSIERTKCYKNATTSQQCESPGQFEQWIKSSLEKK